MVICKWNKCLTSCMPHNVFVKLVIFKLDYILRVMYLGVVSNFFICVKILKYPLFFFIFYFLAEVGHTKWNLLKPYWRPKCLSHGFNVRLASTACKYTDVHLFAPVTLATERKFPENTELCASLANEIRTWLSWYHQAQWGILKIMQSQTKLLENKNML